MMEWDAYIEKESEFVVLPEGDYDFIVTSFEKGWFDGSAKVEACNKAMLELTIKAPGLGTSIVKEQLLLSDSQRPRSFRRERVCRERWKQL